MKNGYLRFEKYLSIVEVLLKKAETKKDPGLWLYKNNLRSSIFMLESLTKLYSGLHNKKKFKKLEIDFKNIEDAIGIVDYYDGYYNEFRKRKDIKSELVKFLLNKKNESISKLNQLLIEEKWIFNKTYKTQKIIKKLEDISWLEEEKEMPMIKKLIERRIEKIDQFLEQAGPHFDNIESDVHEFRRKIRWLSIFTQSLQGSIQLSTTKNTPKNLSQFITKEVKSSPFNQMPAIGKNQYLLKLDKSKFYALSWFIAELGKIKDEGLRIVVVKEAIDLIDAKNKNKNYEEVYKILGKNQKKEAMLLKQGENLCMEFTKHKILNNLVLKIEKISSVK